MAEFYDGQNSEGCEWEWLCPF